MAAVDVLHDRAQPFCDEHGVAIDHLLTDNGREHCGRPLSHPFELYLAINQITPRRTEIGSPETNGVCERFHRTVKEEVFAVAFWRTFYESVAQLQADLDTYLTFYNRGKRQTKTVLTSREEQFGRIEEGARGRGLRRRRAARRSRPSPPA